MARKRETKRLGDILVDAGLVTNEQIDEVLENKIKGEKIGEVLIRFGYATDSEIVDALQESTGIRRIDLSSVEVDKEVLKLIDENFVNDTKIMPLFMSGRRLVVATNDPLDYPTVESIRLRTGLNVETVLATKIDIETAISRSYGFSKTLENLGINAQLGEEDKAIAAADDIEDEAENPIVQLVNQILITAIKGGASDIHIDPLDKEFLIRYRVDGILSTEKTLPKMILPKLVSRIKVMAHMDITDTRTPQDGRIKTVIEGKGVDLRISTLPTVRGEKCVLRVLDLSKDSAGIDRLGFYDEEEKVFRGIISKPNGIVLISGPTGSGKTTTLYACLDELNDDEINLITVEDPVEIEMQGVNQVNVNPDIDFTFASALRSILRQDPNIIMVGEIRDLETAEISVRASLTGHLVLSTIHTNSSVKTISRLVDMGIDSFLVSSSLSGIVAQRLIRKLCTHCAREEDVTVSERKLLEENNIHVDRIKHPVGCPACNNKGYKGRVAIFEILNISDAIRKMISNEEDEYAITDQAKEEGTCFLLESGLKKVKEGITSIEEVLKVVME